MLISSNKSSLSRLYMSRMHIKSIFDILKIKHAGIFLYFTQPQIMEYENLQYIYLQYK